MSELTGQMHFEFKDWKECFKVWKESVQLYGNEMCLIIDCNSYTSGYWIEKLPDKLDNSNVNIFIYQGDEVLELEKRIIAEHELANSENRSPQLTL